MNKHICACLICTILSLPTGGCRKRLEAEAIRFPVKDVGFPSATDALGEYCLKKIRSDKRPNIEVYIGGSAPASELKRLTTIIEGAKMKVSLKSPVGKNGAPPTITLLVQGLTMTERSVSVALTTIYGPRNGSDESIVFRNGDDGWVLESARETAVY